LKAIEKIGLAEVDDQRSMSLTYGRLSGILAFSGVTAVAMANDGRSIRDIAVLAPYTARYIEQKIRRSWPSAKRSWADFVATANKALCVDRLLRVVWKVTPVAKKSLSFCFSHVFLQSFNSGHRRRRPWARLFSLA